MPKILKVARLDSRVESVQNTLDRYMPMIVRQAYEEQITEKDKDISDINRKLEEQIIRNRELERRIEELETSN